LHCQDILLGAPGSNAWRGMQVILSRIHVIFTKLLLTHLGAVFRRQGSNGATRFSSNGVGSDSVSYQGYDVITGRINSRTNPSKYINDQIYILF